MTDSTRLRPPMPARTPSVTQRFRGIRRALVAVSLGLAWAGVTVAQPRPWVPPSLAPGATDPIRYLKGPVGNGVYINVVIESDTVGVLGDTVTLIDSTVRAPVCVRTAGQGVTIRNNTLDCGLCVEFTSPVLIKNTLIGNRCSGRGTNRPDVFGW